MYKVYFQNEGYNVEADYFETYPGNGIYIFYKRVKGQLQDYKVAHFPIQGTVIINRNPFPEESEK